MSFEYFSAQWSKGYKMCDAKADGHCAIHAVSLTTMGRNALAAEVTTTRANISGAMADLSQVSGVGLGQDPAPTNPGHITVRIWCDAWNIAQVPKQ